MVGAQHECSGVFPLQSLDAASHLAHNLAEATGRPLSLKILLPPNAALMLPCCREDGWQGPSGPGKAAAAEAGPRLGPRKEGGRGRRSGEQTPTIS